MNRFFAFALMATACSDNSLKVVNSVPEAEITYPTEGAEVLEAVEQALYGWVADRDGPTEDLWVRWYQGADTLLCEGVVPDSSGDVFCTAAFEMDAVSVRLEVVDKRGGLGQDSVDFNMVPTDAPTAEILRPEGEFGFYVGQLITFEGVVADGEDEASTLTAVWESTIDGPLDTIEASPNPSGELLGFGELTEGEHGITLTVTDSTGKQATDSVVVAVGPPNTAPTCEITAPEMGSMFNPGEAITFVANAQDVDVPSDWLDVAWRSDQDGEIGNSTPSTLGEVLFATDALSSGTHTITMVVSDDQGSTCTDNIIATVGAPPIALITSPADGAVVQEGASVSFTAEVSDTDDGADALDIAWTSSIDELLDSSDAAADGSAGFTTDALRSGTHTISLSATDPSGELAEDAIALTVNGQPVILSVIITTEDADVRSSSELNCEAIATDPEGETPTITYIWTNSTTGSTLDAGADETTVALTPETTSPDDTIVCTATATDTAGGSASDFDSVVVINVLPSAPEVTASPAVPSPLDDLRCSISAPATDPDGDTLSYDFAWTVGGLVSAYNLTGATSSDTLDVPSLETRPDEVWTCSVTAHDGTGTGPTGTDNVTVQRNCGSDVPGIAVSTCEELQAMDDDPTEDYCLVNDIECGEIADFESISSDTFSGSLAGNDFTIFDFSSTGSGMFLRLYGEVRDLHMVDVNITEGESPEHIVGTLAKTAGFVDDDGFVIHNVHVTGTVNRLDAYQLGGLVGSATNGVINESSFVGDLTHTGVSEFGGTGGLIGHGTGGGDLMVVRSHSGGSISGEGYIGGLVGTASIHISESHSSANVTGASTVGGLVGKLVIWEGSGIERSFSTGTTTGEIYLGGLVGYLGLGSVSICPSAVISDSYAAGDLIVSEPAWGSGYVGGLVGGARFTGEEAEICSIERSYSAHSIESDHPLDGFHGGLVGHVLVGVSGLPLDVTASYWDTESSGTDTSDGGEGRTTAEMITEATFVDWDFTDTWTIDEGTSYPCLQWQGEDCPVP